MMTDLERKVGEKVISKFVVDVPRLNDWGGPRQDTKVAPKATRKK